MENIADYLGMGPEYLRQLHKSGDPAVRACIHYDCKPGKTKGRYWAFATDLDKLIMAPLGPTLKGAPAGRKEAGAWHPQHVERPLRVVTSTGQRNTLPFQMEVECHAS